jgi:hypothetical protein
MGKRTRRRSDKLQSAGQGRFNHLASINGSLSFAEIEECVNLVDKTDDVS